MEVLAAEARFAEDRRRGERKLWTAFEQAHAKVLDALLTAVSTAIRRLAHLRIDRLPRMADFARWVEAAAPAFGWAAGEFLYVYQQNRGAAVTVELEASPVAPILIAYLEQRGPVKEMLVHELLSVSEDTATDGGKRPSPAGWPKKPQELGAALKRLAPTLRAQGIEITHHTRSKAGQRISIVQVPQSPSHEP